MIVPAGGLSSDDMEWIASDKKYLLPVKALSSVFRGIFTKVLQKAIADNKIKLPDEVKDFLQLKSRMYSKKWVVNAEKPLSGPEKVIESLGRYTNRVAITNNRLKGDEKGKITFDYKDYKSAGIIRSMTLDADEFIKRFFMHILPCGFYKIRHFGIMAQCNKSTRLALCFELLESDSFFPQLDGLPAVDVWELITGKNPFRCPACNEGKMKPLAMATEKTKKKMQPG